MTSAIDSRQYLTKDDIMKVVPDVHVKADELGSTDTYHEEKLLKKFLSLDKNIQVLLIKCAVQMAIIGYGRKNYNFIRIDDKNIMKLEDIFKKNNVKYNEKLNEKYNDDELSARRLLRLFRYHIQRFIIENNRPSFLWLKYADKSNKDYAYICFPGAEHIINSVDEATFLMKTYSKIDLAQNTQFVQRLNRVFIARGIINPII